MDNQVIGYKDLAAIPKDKAILEVERPDLMVYEPHFNMSALDRISLSRSREVSNTLKGFHPNELWIIMLLCVPEFIPSYTTAQRSS